MDAIEVKTLSCEQAQALIDNGVIAVAEGGNVAGFMKVANAMMAQGIV